MNVGNRLKKLRKSYNFTQTQVAEYLGYNQGQVARLENNSRNLKEESLEKLCRLYNCSEDYILDGENFEEINFRCEVKNIDLNTIAQMNHIIGNLEILSDFYGDD